MKKQIIGSIILVVIITILTVLTTVYTYSLYESDAVSPATANIAKWNIKVNNSMITGLAAESRINIGSIDWQSSGHVRSGKAAPGSIGSFEIEIDPTDTQVSFIYELELEIEDLDNDEFQVHSVTETNGHTIVRTGEKTYSGIVTLTDIANEELINIEVNVIWNNNEDNNDKDYELGIKAGAGVYIPVRINLTQYHGTEVLTPYVEPSNEPNVDPGE